MNNKIKNIWSYIKQFKLQPPKFIFIYVLADLEMALLYLILYKTIYTTAPKIHLYWCSSCRSWDGASLLWISPCSQIMGHVWSHPKIPGFLCYICFLVFPRFLWCFVSVFYLGKFCLLFKVPEICRKCAE